jgi:hypothetical protein
VLGHLQYQVIERSANIARQQIPAFAEIKAITKKATIPNKPIGDQLSRNELAQFSEVRQRLLAMNLASLLESRRERLSER